MTATALFERSYLLAHRRTSGFARTRLALTSRTGSSTRRVTIQGSAFQSWPGKPCRRASSVWCVAVVLLGIEPARKQKLTADLAGAFDLGLARTIDYQMALRQGELVDLVRMTLSYRHLLPADLDARSPRCSRPAPIPDRRSGGRGQG